MINSGLKSRDYSGGGGDLYIKTLTGKTVSGTMYGHKTVYEVK